mmetsp:Transcript_44633/g.136156  ORF Transcript_44633/g.136156 Transcript_44633/m.136156 type:complete len:259 (-) Transcript_44633:332-1108(-)
MSVTKAYVQKHDGGEPESEHADVLRVLEGRGVPCELFTRKRLDRRQLSPLSPRTLVVGDHDAMRQAFRYLGVPKGRLPADTYPPSMRSYLKRSVWRSTAGRVREAASAGATTVPIFVKPVSDTKKFTGLVVSPLGDLSTLHAVSKKTDVYCSEVVEWLSEYRVFVNRTEIVGVRHYAGDATVELDMKMVKDFVQDFEGAEDATRAYAADFGVLERDDERVTALVEWNDGYALGSYGLNGEVYTGLLISRWEEIFERNA